MFNSAGSLFHISQYVVHHQWCISAEYWYEVI